MQETPIDLMIREALEELGTEILNIYKAQAPRRTGKLQNSIRYKVVRKSGELSLSFYYIYYGVYVDLGTFDNADTASFGISPFEMPRWNSAPPRSIRKGIVPRYWTSLSADADELVEWFNGRLETALEDGFGSLFDRVTSRSQRNTQ
jgi:8-oxo-dGTP pyrophosphatase MutT (NUDIX family)